MSDKKKRIIFAIIFIIVCIGIGYLLYRVFFYKEPETYLPDGTNIPGEQIGTELPTAGEIGEDITDYEMPEELPSSDYTPSLELEAEPEIVTKKIDSSVSNLTIDQNKDTINFYNENDGKFYRLKNDGTVVSMSDKVFYNVDAVTWAPTTNQAILEYPDGSNIYYNFDTNKQVTLPTYWEDFSFASQGDKIAAKSIALAPENRWLITSNPDGKNVSYVEHMGENANKVIVDWSPTRQFVALSTTGEPLGGDRQEVLFVGQNGENFPSIIVEGYGLDTKWSPTGEKLLYNIYSDRENYKPELWITDVGVDNMGANRTALEINTWVDKCTFADSRFLYCAIPQTLPTGSGFAPAVADYTPDNIYKIDLKTGIKTYISTGDDSYTVDSISVSPDQKTLYFTDKNQSGLLSINL